MDSTFKNRIVGSGVANPGDITMNPLNWRRHPELQKSAMLNVLNSVGWVQDVIINVNSGMLIDGHLRVETAIQNGEKSIPVKYVDLTDDEEKTVLATFDPLGAMAISDNEMLSKLVESANSYVDLKTFDEVYDKYDKELEKEDESVRRPDTSKAGALRERFVVPPFSVLDTKQGDWQNRKRAWLSLGISSENGRNEGLVFTHQKDMYELMGRKEYSNGTSIFDPVLCELVYRWFTAKGMKILDPFSGGSVRGIVACVLDRKYTGIDLRQEQITENITQYEKYFSEYIRPEWICGDSINIKSLVNDTYDLVFSCPPYYDLEVYSDKEGDLSSLGTYDEFINSYNKIIANSCSLLNDNSFACFVVGDIRDKKGNYRGFVSDTIEAFENSNLHLYNYAILVNSIGTLPFRVSKYFNSGRKLGKQHQDVLIFLKGDAKKAVQKMLLNENTDLPEVNVIDE